MSDDWLFRVLRRFARPDAPSTPPQGLREIDDRLGTIEREQDAIDARLRLLERQADPRGLGRPSNG